MHFAASLAVADSVRDPAGYYRNNVIGTLGVARGHGGGGLRPVRVLVLVCRLRRAGRDADRRRPSDAAGERLRADQAGGGAGAAALRARLRHARRVPALFQCRRSRSRGRAGRGARPGDSPHPARVRGGGRRARRWTCSAQDYPTPDGTCLRDYIHVSDLAAAHVQALAHLAGGGASATYNVGTETPSSVREVIAAVERVTGRRVPQRLAPRRAGDPAVLFASAARIRRELGWVRHPSGARDDRRRRLALARRRTRRVWRAQCSSPTPNERITNLTAAAAWS